MPPTFDRRSVSSVYTVCTCVCASVHLCVPASVCLCICVSVHRFIFAPVCLCICVYVHLCTSAAVHLCICVSVHLCICASVCLCICSLLAVYKVYMSVCMCFGVFELHCIRLCVFVFVCLNYMSVCMSVCMCTRMWACLCVCAYYVMCLIAVTSYHIGGLGEAYNCTIRAVTWKILSSSRARVLALSTWQNGNHSSGVGGECQVSKHF